MSRIVAWTGHRPELFRDPAAARRAVEEVAAELVQRDAVERFLVGGQRGVDTWAALSAIALGVPFAMLLPLSIADFTAEWSAEDRSVFDSTLAAADQISTIGPAPGYTERNRGLATRANLLVAIWAGIVGGGTFETMSIARAAGVAVREVLLEASPDAASAQGRGI